LSFENVYKDGDNEKVLKYLDMSKTKNPTGQ